MPAVRFNALAMHLYLLGMLLFYRRRRAANNRRILVHPMNQSRRETSVFNRVQQLRQYPDRFHEQFRITPRKSDYLLDLVRPPIQREDTVMRKAIDPETRLCVTLHYLATGSNFRALAFIYAPGRKTVSDLVQDTCQALWTVLSGIYMKIPSSHQEWEHIADKFYEIWNFPNCLGAIDGKHITIRAPDNSGTVYFNYKKSFSINLMAVASADYRFLMIDVGRVGSASDGGIWARSQFGEAWKQGQVNVPAPTELLGTADKMAYVMVADEAFPLQPNLLRPYPGRELTDVKRIYNYPLSRAQRVVENAFGILTSRWRVLFTPIDADAEKATCIVKATCALHNMLCTVGDNAYAPVGYGDQVLPNGQVAQGFWRVDQQLQGLAAPPRGHAVAATAARNRYAEWFSAEGRAEWQEAHINRIN